MKIYSIKDQVANEFGPLSVLKNDFVATRWYKQTVQQYKLNSEEYSAYCLGTFDTETGVIVPELRQVVITDIEPADSPTPATVDKDQLNLFPEDKK